MTTATTALKTRLMVGMEIHVELATRSKMWTSAPNVAHPDYFDAPPNTLLDPVVIGMPGVLPVMNKQAVEMAMRVGRALNCTIARHTKWDRKSYYYPDLPKNYQISQYDLPLCGQGALEIPTSDEPDAPTKTVRILRAHLEEDAGKLLHDAPGGIPIDHSIVDLNRAGTPLLEIVTEPDLETPEQCVVFGQALRNICRHLGVSQGIMQKGHIRFEPNINVIIEKDGQTYRTPIVEIKNLNSFKALYNAVAYEYQRQVDEWLETGRVMGQRAKSTRGWDDVRNITTHQRHKEDADEYRYFPDPDLVDLKVDDAWLKRIDDSIPELPLVRQRKYVSEYGLSPVNARTLVDEPQVTAFFEDVIAQGVEPKRAAALLLNYGAKHANAWGCRIDELGITPRQIKEITDLIDAGKLSSNAVDTLFGFCMHHPDKSINELASYYSLIQVSDTGELETYIMGVLVDPSNKKIIEDIRNGKDKAIGALVGQVMKSSSGQTNPTVVADLIKQKLQG